MDQLKTETELSTNTHIIDYSKLVDSVQLSVARILDMPGAFDADNFTTFLESKPSDEHERIICEVGGQFDEVLINFVIAALISNRSRLVILAKASEGINGGLPWQPKLEQHLQHLKGQGQLQGAQLTVERYSIDDQTIEQATEEARAAELETTLSI